MADLSFLNSKATPLVSLQETNQLENPSLKTIATQELKPLIPFAEAATEGKKLYDEIKEDGFKKTESSNTDTTGESSSLSFLNKKAKPVTVTDWERIQYGFAKESWILGNLFRIGSAKTKDWLDNNSENNKTYKQHIQDQVSQEKQELDEKYWKFKDGKYDKDSLVKLTEFATIIFDPMYMYLYGTPVGRKALQSYTKFAAFSGATAALDKSIRDLAQKGEFSALDTATVGGAGVVLGPIGKYGFDKIGKIFGISNKKTLEKVAQVVTDKTKKKFGNISDKELFNIRKVLADKKVISANKLIEADLNFMSKFKNTTNKFIKDEKALLTEYKRIVDSKLIAKKIKDLTKKKEILKADQLKKRLYPESGLGITRRLTEVRTKITKLENEFGKLRADYLLKNQKQFAKVADKIGKRNNLIIERLQKLESPITRKVLRPLLSVSTLPLGGVVAGATMDAIWGDEAGVAEGAMWGLAAGATIKAVGASKVLNLAQKQKIFGFVWGDAQKLWMQKAREITAGTLATKLEAFGGNTKAFGFQLLENIDNPMAGQSVVRRAYTLEKNWERANRALIKNVNERTGVASPYTKLEQAGAISILRGSDDKFLLENKRVVELAKKTKDQLDIFNETLRKAGIYKELQGIEFGSKGIVKFGSKGEVITDKSQMALRRKQFQKDIDYYFPREYDREVIHKNQALFRQTIENIMKNLKVKNYVEAASSFIESTRVPGSFKMIDETAIKNFVTTLNSKKSQFPKQWFPTPLTEHISTERMLNGPYKIVEKALEKHNFLNNNIEEVLNNLGTKSFKSIAFTERFGPNGNFIVPLLRGIRDKYKNAAEKSTSNIKEKWGQWSNDEATVLVDTINAYFGRHGNQVTKTNNVILGMLSTGSNLAMLNNVFFASLGDFMQGFINSRNTTEFFKAFARTGFTAKREKGLARWMNLHFDDEITKANLKPLVVGDNVSVKGVKDWLDSGRYGAAFNNLGFQVMGMSWLTGAARRFAFNVGAGDGYASSRQLYNLLNKGKRDINSAEALEITKWLQRLGISTSEALKVGSYKNYKTAIQNKEVSKILTKAGISTSNRDAIIPQVSNRLLFAQSRNPNVRILAQFMSWAQAKTSQTNKIVQRIENGDVRNYIKLLMALPVYSSIQQIREFTKYGEVRTDFGQRWNDHIKYLAEGWRLSGNMGWLPETLVSKAVGPGKQTSPLLFFPAANYLDNLRKAIQLNIDSKHTSSLKYWDKVAPLPIYRRWLKEFWDDKILEKSNRPTKSDFNKFDRKKRKKFNEGELVTSDDGFQSANIRLNSTELTEGVKEAKEDMNIKDIASVAAAATIATTGVDADINKAVENNIIPEQKPEAFDYTEIIKGYEKLGEKIIVNGEEKYKNYKGKGETNVTSGYGSYRKENKLDDSVNLHEANVQLIEDIEDRLPIIKDNIKNFNKFPLEVRQNLVSSWFRGSLSGSPDTLDLINAGKYKEAAKEFLNNDEYKNAIALDRRGIIKRMDATAKAIESLSTK